MAEAITTSLFNVINYFHTNDRVNRVDFGLSKYQYLNQLLEWRISELLLLVILFVLYFLVYWIEPFQRQFVISDVTINHPFAEHERVNNAALFFYAVWSPLTIIGIVSIIITKPKNKVYVTYVSIVGLLVSVFLTSVVTDLLKNFIGRHRPDFIARCIPDSNADINILVNAIDVCTTTDYDRLKDGFRTTPSGHLSLSFAGLLYLSLWLAGQLVVTNSHLGSWRSIVAASPTLVAMLIALSRTEDYRHHFIDIIIGSSIGICIAYTSYRKHFPSITHPQSYEPYTIIEQDQQSQDNHDGYNRLESV